MNHFIDLLWSDGWGVHLLDGVALTLGLAVATLPFGLAFGLLLAKAQDRRTSKRARVASLVVTVFRALPELLTIVMVYYGGQIALKAALNFMGVTENFEISAFVAGMIALTLVFGAFSSEVFRAALNAVPRGQGEASHALGLSPTTAFVRVLFPQMWRVAIPGLGNLWLVLLKDTSLVSVIALPDLMRQTGLAVSATREPFFFYLVAFCIYLVLSIISGSGMSWLERRANHPYLLGGK